MRRYFACCASSSDIARVLEHRARVGPARVEEERVEVVAEVVVVLDVALRARQVGAGGQARPPPPGLHQQRRRRAAPHVLRRHARGSRAGPPGRRSTSRPRRTTRRSPAGRGWRGAARGPSSATVTSTSGPVDGSPAVAHRAVGQPHRDAAAGRGAEAPQRRAPRDRRAGASAVPRAAGAGPAATAAAAPSATAVATRALARREPGLAVERDLLHRELHRLPVDESGHLLGHQGIAHQGAGDAGIRQRVPHAGQLGPERVLPALGDADARVHPSRRAPRTRTGTSGPCPKNGETCITLAVLVHLPRAVLHPVRRRQQVAVPLAEGVGHLGDDRGERPVGGVAVEVADRVEDVAEQPQVRDQQHPPAGQVDAVLGEERDDVLLARPLRVAQVVAVAEASAPPAGCSRTG